MGKYQKINAPFAVGNNQQIGSYLVAPGFGGSAGGSPE